MTLGRSCRRVRCEEISLTQSSYNVPAEYLPTSEEKEAWENADPEEREKEYLPQKFDSLRKVPGYGKWTADGLSMPAPETLTQNPRNVRQGTL